jgi:lipopolysaccharide transport protein LptA
VKAAVDITFSDGHHELEQVHLEIYPPVGGKPDQITAHRAVYLPEFSEQGKGQMMANTNTASPASTTARIIFTGDVNIETRDSMKVRTEKLVYDQKTEIGETNDPVSFERQNISGHATGVVVDAKNKKLEMRNAVEITVAPEAKPNAPQQQGTRALPATIRSAHATFDQSSMHLLFTGGATAEQGQDVMSGETLSATLNQQKQLQKIEARGNSYLRSMQTGRSAEVHSADMDFFMNGQQQLERALASRDVQARSLDADSQMELTGATALDVNFQKQGERSLLKEMRADGRSVLKLAAPKSTASDPRAADKQLTADAVKLYWHTTGRDLEKAEAVGNAELVVDTVQKSAQSDRKTLTAPRFDCDFYEAGNLARNFTATGGESRVVMEPHQPTADRSTRTLVAQKISAVFVRQTQDIERLDAQGDAKFNEQDRNGRAATASYTAADETVRLRGGEPVVWDSRARTKATEIDTDTRSDISFTRGKTATTYYSQEQTNGATPFSKVKSPVFIVSDRAEFRHLTGVAIYTGGARAWQDDNFVKADRLTIYRENQRMEADGHVQSVLYQARNKRTEVVPALATSDRMSYSDADRILHYEGTVDIKQGTDRIQSATADVYLLKETNEVEKTIAQRDVIVTQPGRQGNGDWAQYTAADETVVLKGNPARVVDVDKGTTEGGRLTVYLRDDRVVADDARGPQSPGRVRSTHKIRRQ